MGPRGAGRARSALAALGAALALVSVAACGNSKPSTAETTTTVAPETTTTTEAPLSAGKQISFYVPEVGDCFDVRTADKAPPIYLKLDCGLPHEKEVFAIIDFTGKDYPGQQYLETEAKRTCTGSWEAYVGQSYETSSYEIGYLLPDPATWGNGIHHVTGCLIQPGTTDRLSGSAKGTAQ